MCVLGRTQLENVVTSNFMRSVLMNLRHVHRFHRITGSHSWLHFNVSKVYSQRCTNKWHAVHWAWTAIGAYYLVIFWATLIVKVKERMMYESVLIRDFNVCASDVNLLCPYQRVDCGRIKNIIGVCENCSDALYAISALWVYSATIRTFFLD